MRNYIVNSILLFSFLLLLFWQLDTNEKYYELKQDYEQANEILSSMLDREIERASQIDKIYFHMEKKDRTLAEIVYRAAKEYELDSILLVALINSESGFNPANTHKHSEVKGLGGIHSKYWKVPNESLEEQIYATALVLNFYMTKYQDPIKALTAYKGISDAGRQRAYNVWNDYIKRKES